MKKVLIKEQLSTDFLQCFKNHYTIILAVKDQERSKPSFINNYDLYFSEVSEKIVKRFPQISN